MSRQLVLSLLVLLLAVITTRAGEPLPGALEGVGFDPPFNEQVPADLELVDEEGHTVHLRDYFSDDRPVLLMLAYYRCPMLCTMSLNGLTRSLQDLAVQRQFRMGQDFLVLTISFDHRETAALARAKKRSHAEQYGHPGADTGWHFLTGSEQEIRRLTDALHFRFRFDERTQQYAHASGLLVLTPEGRVSRFFPGIEFQASDLYFGLEEASQHRIGTPITDRLALLFCYSYDPTTGSYQMQILNAVRIGGVVTLLALGGLLGFLWRREWKTRHLVECKS
ncbi:MAG: SCO family protein [Gemmataceae bacterium]